MFPMLSVNVRLAVRSLSRNRLRTALTMLGIVIGVAAVLTMVALGTGARASVESEVASAGTNLIFVRSGNYTRGGESVGIAAGRGAATTLIPEDGQAILAQVAGIKAMSPGLSLRSFITADGKRAFVRVQGVAPAFAEIYAWTLGPGRMFPEGVRDQVVLGRGLAEQLFGAGTDPIGQVVELRNARYVVSGVTDGLAEDHRDVLFLPWQALQESLGQQHLESFFIAAERAGETSRIAAEITALLRERHGIAGPPPEGYLAGQGGAGGEPDDFTVETQAAKALTKGLYTPAAAFALANLPKLDEVTLEEMADTLDRSSSTMTALLASIAGVSLIVGGIGIMNIMLVSITERTREIGLRMATGARSLQVAQQFLIEAVTLSVTGGIVGLLLGLLAARLVGWSLGWPASVSLSAMALAMGIAAAVGLIFGSYPARRASLLDPIDALRTE